LVENDESQYLDEIVAGEVIERKMTKKII